MTPRISVVIPAFNEEYELPRTLAAFKLAFDNYKTVYRDKTIEFIVVDNASTDRTAEIARTWGARVVHEPHRQIARARNAGAEAAQGDILVTCDADSLPHPQIFLKIESEIARGIFAGGVRVWAKPLKLTQFPVFLLVNLVSLLCKLPGGMYFIKRDDFFAVGEFDETLFALEDVDFAHRIKQAARRQHKKLSILWKYPILTSTRKFRVSRISDWFRLGFLAIVLPKKYLKDRSYWENLYYSPTLREQEETSN